MGTEHTFVIWNCIRIKGEVSRESNWFKLPLLFSTDRSKAVNLLQFFVRALLGSYVMCVSSLSVPHLSFFWFPLVCMNFISSFT